MPKSEIPLVYGAVRKYSASPSLLIMAEFPEHAWMPWKFSATMKSWWPNLADNFRKGDPVAEAVMRQFIDTDVAQEVFPRIDTVCYSEWVELCQRAAASDSTLPPLSPTTRTRLDHFTDVETRKGYDALVQIIWRLFNDLNKTPITPQSRTTLANGNNLSLMRQLFHKMSLTSTKISYNTQHRRVRSFGM